jgi:outer membrane receptor protein involved in Fe transport
VPNKALMPSLASELEIGTEMRLFDNRLSLDFTWYRKTSTNEIVNAPASSTSGFTSAALNIGKIRNTGFEGLVTLTPFRNPQGFTWSTSFNGTINKNEILALATGDAPLTWATARSGIAYVQHRVCEPAAQVVAYEYAGDANGSIERHPLTGLPLPSNVLTSQGSAYHKWLAGWINEFSYKRLNFGFLIDGKFGGKIYSNTESTSTSNGKNKLTLVGRDDIWGINRTAQQYYSNLTNISALFVKDASFIKFRQVSLGYSFPNNMFNNRLKSLNVSFVGRNLFTLMKKTDNIDPEAAYSGQAIGLEMGVLPPQRTYGINLSARF